MKKRFVSGTEAGLAQRGTHSVCTSREVRPRGGTAHPWAPWAPQLLLRVRLLCPEHWVPHISLATLLLSPWSLFHPRSSWLPEVRPGPLFHQLPSGFLQLSPGHSGLFPALPEFNFWKTAPGAPASFASVWHSRPSAVLPFRLYFRCSLWLLSK